MLKQLIATVFLAFLLGWTAHALYTEVPSSRATVVSSSLDLAGKEAAAIPASVHAQFATDPIPPIGSPASRDKPSPSDWLTPSDVHVTGTRVLVDVPSGHRFETAVFTNTKSMDPVIDAGAQAIQIVPESPDEIKVGDIISYAPGQITIAGTTITDTGIIIHRVIAIGSDKDGWYAIAKGDNNPSPDPLKVRFSMVKHLLVGVFY
jgi:signal peptidase I